MKKALLLTILLFVALQIYADNVVKVGIVNIDLIIQSHFRESAAYRELEALIREYENGLDSIRTQVLQLQERKLQAEKDGDDERALELETEIFRQQRFMQNYHDVRTARINEQRDRLFSEGVSSEIFRHIKHIAETQGYSLIFKHSDPNILFWSEVIDITDAVLNSLRRASN